VLLTKYYSSDQIQKNETGERRSAYMLLGKREERMHFKGLGIAGRIILKWIFKKGMRALDWIDLAQDWDR